MARKPNVTTYFENGVWKNKVDGNSRASNVSATKAEAQRTGRQMAVDRGAELMRSFQPTVPAPGRRSPLGDRLPARPDTGSVVPPRARTASYRELVASDKHIHLRPWMYTIARNRCHQSCASDSW